MPVGVLQKFNSTASGGLTPYAYQWYLNDSAISGANSNNWTFTPGTTGHYKLYLNVTDALNFTVQSNIVTDITVYPVVTDSISPIQVNVTVGTIQQFSSNVTGGLPPYTYQWYYMNGTAITGAKNPTLNYMTNSTRTINIYLNVTDSLNYTTKTNTTTIKVYSQPFPTIDPTIANMTVGTIQQFTSTVTGGLIPYTYQWYLNDSAVSVATGSAWNFTAAIAGHYKVYVYVTDTLGYKVQSNIVTDITVNPLPTDTINPTNANMTVGSLQIFSGTVSGGTSPYTFQWYVNSTTVLGATSANWTFVPTTAGTYNIYLNVTDNNTVTVESNTASAKVETPTTVNITSTQNNMYIGQSQTFSSNISGGTSPYTYQW